MLVATEVLSVVGQERCTTRIAGFKDMAMVLSTYIDLCIQHMYPELRFDGCDT